MELSAVGAAVTGAGSVGLSIRGSRVRVPVPGVGAAPSRRSPSPAAEPGHGGFGQMAGPELGLLFQRRFLAARQLRGMPWAVSWAGLGAAGLGRSAAALQLRSRCALGTGAAADGRPAALPVLPARRHPAPGTAQSTAHTKENTPGVFSIDASERSTEPSALHKPSRVSGRFLVSDRSPPALCAVSPARLLQTPLPHRAH